MVWVLDFRSVVQRLQLPAVYCRVTTLGSCTHICVSVSPIGISGTGRDAVQLGINTDQMESSSLSWASVGASVARSSVSLQTW